MRSRIMFATLVWSLLVLLLAACSDDGGDDDRSGEPPTATAVPQQRVEINQPRVGRAVAVPFAVAGSANVDASPVYVRVVAQDGSAICERSAAVVGPAGGLGNWAMNFSFDPALAATPGGGASVTLRAWTVGLGGGEQDIVMVPVAIDPTPPDIVIEEPRCNSVIARPSGTVTASGVAQVFEAQLTVQLQDQDGDVIASQDVLTSDAGSRSPWQATFDLAAVAETELEVVAFSISAEDGSVINEFRVPITITE